MSMIKCPECGRQISDKAPYCPNCGVAIAGKIIKCPQCGEIYFRDQEMCPNCHHLTRISGTVGNVSEAGSATVNDNHPIDSPAPPQPPVPPIKPLVDEKQDKPKKKNHTALIVAAILVVLVCAGCFYFYNNAKSAKEQEAYEFALKSDDPLVLQTYLDNYKDAPVEHIDSITTHLEMLKQNDQDWNNAVVSGSKQALMDFLSKHPDSEHRAEAQHKIDSLDWVMASNENTADALQAYIEEHANGEHIDEANDALRQLKANTVQPEEKELVHMVLRQFFQAINSKSQASLESSVAPILSNFLGKQDATKADVVTFMNKIYKDDIINMTWHLGNDLKISKKEVGDNEYQYSASVSATQDIDRTDPNKEKQATYKINAEVGPDGLINAMTMTKILQ